MAENNYKEFDKVSDKSPIVPDIRISNYTFKAREVALAGCAFILIIVVVILAALLASTKTSGTEPIGSTSLPLTGEQPCFTPGCLESASYTIRNMNASVDPCQDFQKYACDNFPSNYPLDPDRPEKSPLFNLLYRNEDKLRRLLETSAVRDKEWSSEKKLKDVFMSCKDDYMKMKAAGNPFATKIISNSGGWYVLGTWDNTSWSLQESLKKVHIDYWTQALFTYRLVSDWYNWKVNAIEVDMGGMGMSWQNYLQPHTEKIHTDYKKFMRTIAKLLVRDSGYNISDADRDQRIETFISDVYTIEYNLANVTDNTMPDSDSHSVENRVSLAQLNTMTNGQIDMVDFFQYMFNEAGVNGGTKVILLESDYISRMTLMLKNLGPDKNRILNNYLTWRMAMNYVQDLSWEYIHANREFYVDKYGIPEFLGTWRYCFYYVDHVMKDALSALYVRDHFSDANKKKAHEIVKYVKNALLKSTNQSTIMDKVTQRTAIAKLRASLDKLGYPEFMVDDYKLDSIYQSLTVNRSDFFQNVLNINRFQQKDWNRRLKEGEDRSEWRLHTYDTGLQFYNPWNELIVPAGLLQFPIYDRILPHFQNFGSLGTLIGHYLVHGIDQWGSYYDKDGKWNDWWSNQTTKNFEKAQKCVEDAFANITLGPFETPGSSEPVTLPVYPRYFSSEAMSITSGVRLSFRAYQDWVKQNGVEKVAPGLKLTNDQSFFLAYGQTMCFNRHPYLSFQYAMQGRIPEDSSTNGVLAQLEEFSTAFNCPAGSPMNATKKCTMF